MKTPIFLCLLSIAFNAFGDVKPGWSNESELGLSVISGNTESESYNGKQKLSYVFENEDALIASGRYIEAKTSGAITAKSWAAELRYEKSLSEHWSVFAAQGAESDRFAGYVQRDNTDLGGKYYFVKSDENNLLAELGYRSTTTNPVAGDRGRSNFGRAYLEYSRKKDKSWEAKIWAEYLPNFTRREAYLANLEPSFSVMLSEIFSLKATYLVKYQNELSPPNTSYTDTTWTTTLVAKF